MQLEMLRQGLLYNRDHTLGLIKKIEDHPETEKILAYRPGPGRAHIAWQLMHLGATEDRHLNKHLRKGTPIREDYEQRFAGGSTVDDDIPALSEITTYLADRRADLLAYLDTLTDDDLDKIALEARGWDHRRWLYVLAWHEGHHQGQAHLTLNMYNALKAQPIAAG